MPVRVEARDMWARRQRVLRSAVRRCRPVACWYIGLRDLVVATLVATDDEPRLVDCAALRCEWQAPSSMLCPGLLEIAHFGASSAVVHVAALEASALPATDEDIVEIDHEGARSSYSRAGIRAALATFRRARLPLVSLHGDVTARLALGHALGATHQSVAGSLTSDPLAAVTVAPDCEAKASALGSSLTVPIGLALALMTPRDAS
jgi:hypothetical protein